MKMEQQKNYAYNSNGDLESIADTNGVVTKTFEYESDGKTKKEQINLHLV